MKKDLCSQLGSKDNLTVVRKINTDYGSERAIMNGYVYEDEATLKKIENKYVMLRHLTKAEQDAEKERVKAAKQAEAPVKKKKK
jgi:ribosomal protein S24E